MKYLFLSFLLPIVSFASDVKDDINFYIFTMEWKLKLQPGILKAIAFVESSENHKAFVKHDGNSKQSSYGLFQIQYAAAKQVGFKGKAKDLMNPKLNIEYAALYFKWLLDKYKGDYAKALTCYNSGPYSDICKSDKYSGYAGKVLNAYISNR